MDWAGASAIGWLFDGRRGASDRLIARWLFLRALGIIYFSAFFSHISGPRAHRPNRNSARRKLSSSRRTISRTLASLLVCTDLALVLQRIGHAEWAVLRGNDRLGTAATQSVATRNARGLFRLLSIIRKRGAGLFWLPVGWNVARSGIYLSLLRTARISP